jgi:hypothetical protein
MTLKEQLLSVGDAFAAAVGLSRSRVSTVVLNRGSTLDAIAAGKVDVTTGTFEKAMFWFSSNWPDGVDWPVDVVRPQPERPVAGDTDDFDAPTPAGVVAGSESQAGGGPFIQKIQEMAE